MVSVRFTFENIIKFTYRTYVLSVTRMITKAISKMASGKAAGLSGIVAEMLKPVVEAGAVEVHDLFEDIISEGCIPTDWQESFIVNLYKGKGDALNRLSKWWRCWSVWWRDSSGKELRSMRCSVASCLAVALLMQFLLYVSYRRSTWLSTSRSTWPSLTWRKHLIEFHGMSSGGQCAN